MADELENVVEESEETEETPVSEIPYPEGTAPPELDDAVHADIQFTLTEAVISAAGDVDAETLANMRKGTAKEAMEIMNEATYSSLSEALADSLGSGGGDDESPFPMIKANWVSNDVEILYDHGKYKQLGYDIEDRFLAYMLYNEEGMDFITLICGFKVLRQGVNGEEILDYVFSLGDMHKPDGKNYYCCKAVVLTEVNHTGKISAVRMDDYSISAYVKGNAVTIQPGEHAAVPVSLSIRFSSMTNEFNLGSTVISKYVYTGDGTGELGFYSVKDGRIKELYRESGALYASVYNESSDTEYTNSGLIGNLALYPSVLHYAGPSPNYTVYMLPQSQKQFSNAVGVEGIKVQTGSGGNGDV